ncbi:MAG TPA: substrate-binding domain-containing protein [Bauldia sp.]|nr:substrate-binding domain-containing protein [Bauldia sp.]
MSNRIGSAFVAVALMTASVTLAVAGTTTGPNGESATPASAVTLTPEQEAKIRAAGYTAGLAWHTPSDYTAAVDRGAKDEFARLGIEVIAETDAGFDAAKQKNDVETIMAKSPTILLSLPVDPDTAAEVYRPALEAGTIVAFVDNAPKGFVQGKDYVTIVSDDLFQMGEKAADAMAAAIGGKGKVGYLFHDANFYVTNQRDRAFKETIETRYPDIEIVAEMGLADPAKAEDVINAFMLKNPDLDAVYVTWAEPAEFVLAALRNNGNTHTKIVTLDLSEPLALDMVKGGNVAAIVADEAYMIGQTLARAAAASLVGVKLEPFYAVDALAVTKDNVKEGWFQSLHREPPASLTGG